MTGRTLKILLGVSVALNLFAVAGGAALFASRAKVERQVEAEARPGRGHSFMAMIQQLPEGERDRVRQAMRASAHAAKPDFEAARTARKQAVALAGAETFDPVAVQTLLEQSRLAEMRGRARLEGDALVMLGSLSPRDRAVMAPILSRRSSRGQSQHPPKPQAASQPAPQPAPAG
ncbi:MAG TPA: periplasmic heavy metal sensor [Brevundimonas sp.]|uniref:periplasmic heavy metal sensor n=1 Tax=Brevundimonas sp. TaxID=1871086 RepID=UPI00262B36B1|nr:periplasmic heavy metal sensor [Brevundimonas sp.]HRO32586.1 periplasmic heavy metal sensor [Brevundimonas sp.]